MFLVPTRRTAALVTFAVTATLLAGSPFPAEPAGASPVRSRTFQNPLNPYPDPSLTHHHGRYYLTSTGVDRINVWHSASLAGLATAAPTTIWQDSTPGRNRDLWAPALFRLDSGAGPRWYVYYTAGDGTDASHRMYVLESLRDNPLGPYAFKARIADRGEYAIDGEPFSHAGRWYFAWSSPGRGLASGPQQVYAAAMADPWTVTGPVAALPVEAGGCREVREGPTTLARGGRTFLTYSVCDTARPDYQVWAISLPATGDPLRAADWTRHPRPVLARDEAAGVWGPGHHSFFTSPSGRQVWIAYHAKDTAEYTVHRRTTRAQPVEWAADGAPVVPAPVALGVPLALPDGDRGVVRPRAGGVSAGRVRPVPAG